MKTNYKEDEVSKKLDLFLWRRIARFALGHKRLLWPLTLFALILAITDSSFPLITKMAIEVIEFEKPVSDLWLPAIAFFLTSLLLSVCVLYFIQLAGAVSNNIAHDIKRACFKRMQELEFAFYDAQPTGSLISRLTADCDRLSRILAWGIMDILWGFSFVTCMSIVMLILHWKLALIVLSTVLPLIVISVYFQRRMLIASRQIRHHNARITASYSEGISGVKTTKTLGRETSNLSEFAGMSTDMYAASIKRAILHAIYVPLVLGLGSIGSGLALWYGGANVLDEAIPLGTLIAFISFAGNFFEPINQMATVLSEIQGAQAAGERVMGLLATEPKIKDSDSVRDRIDAHKAAASDSIAIDGYPTRIDRIEFKDVDFSYDGKERILEKFNLVAQRGETIALVGASGGGKSTIASLVSRFYEPTGGELRFDGIDYRRRSLDWLQGQLGIVLQTPHLFNGSVSENIRYGKLDATQDEIVEAATLVNAHGFIEKLENGYDTLIGEGGARLSTGEKQLVSFARSLIADPQIFIMDEATSSIDTETEKLIQKGLKKVFDGRISFVIAHRLSTIRTADKIIVISKGRIEEQGKHEELLLKRGHYYKLYTNQFRNDLMEKELSTS